MSTGPAPEEAICTRLLPYSTHRGADTRGEQNRQRAKDRYYRRLGINPAKMNLEDR